MLDVIIGLCLSIPSWMFGGVVFHLCWRWFVVSALGCRELSVGHAMGVSLIATMLTFDPQRTVDAKMTLVATVISRFLTAALVLLFAFVLHEIVS